MPVIFAFCVVIFSHKSPDIYTESGRFIAANHAVLVAPVLELFSNEYESKELRLNRKTRLSSRGRASGFIGEYERKKCR